ncbi:MAG: methyltransferase family protein [Terriglobales bacterium]
MSRGVQRWRVPMGFALAAILVLAARPRPLGLMVGLPVAAMGLLVRGCAAGHIRKNDALATGGPYRYTRNPLYLGSMLMAVGMVIAADSWLLAALAGLMLVAVYLPVIRQEEEFLAGRFGEDFAAYASQVPRLLPRWPRSNIRGGEFSPALYMRHREYQALLGFLAIAAVLIAKWKWM